MHDMYDIACRERERGCWVVRPANRIGFVWAIKPEFYFNLPPLGDIYSPIGPHCPGTIPIRASYRSVTQPRLDKTLRTAHCIHALGGGSTQRRRSCSVYASLRELSIYRASIKRGTKSTTTITATTATGERVL